MTQPPNFSISQSLSEVFREQQRFADGYSPLYAALFGLIADALAGDASDPVADWLVTAAAGRDPFDVTLLLPAALHRDVLAGEPAAAELARYYLTAGTTADGRPPTAASGMDYDLTAVGGRPSSVVLRSAILPRRDALAAFIRQSHVQTNETGRGLAWLLPVACIGWPAVHLVDLGASAGLNLVAEQRGYQLVDADDPERVLLQLGDGPPQFTTTARGPASIPPLACCPTILSRTGGDLHPFHLHTAEDELTLAAFVWGDQPARLERLREGIVALRRTEATAVPVRLSPLRLPDELPRFLAEELPHPLDAPIVLFNTIVTMYLPDRGASLRGLVTNWAARQRVPVLWLQWEPAPPGSPVPSSGASPPTAWSAWTADYWPNDGRAGRRFHLAWVHPHGTALEWTTGWRAFLHISTQN
mgnify:CR=1 FL=1